MGYVRAVAFCCLAASCGFDSNAGGLPGGGSGSNMGSDMGVADATPMPDAPPPPITCGDLICDPRAICHEGTPATCTCPDGFIDENHDGSACNDIDECSMEGACPGKADCENTPGSFVCYTPAKCQDAKDHHVPDGETTIYAGGDLTKPWKAICDGGKDYLELANPTANYARYAKSSGFDSDVTTTYTGVKIDPGSFVVDIKDTKHAASTGRAYAYGRQIDNMMYGTAMDCSNDAAADGTGNIDLTGTAFRVKADQQWVKQGDAGHPASMHSPARDAPSGMATPSSDNQVIALTGGGYCGWVAPANGVQLPFDGQSNNTQILKLEYRSPP